MKNDEYNFVELVLRLKESVHLAMTYIESVEPEMFSNDIMRQDAVCKRLENIGEIANNLKKLYPEVLEKHSSVPWREIIGLRNRAVHDYQNIDHDMIHEIAKNDLPVLLQTLNEMKFGDKIE